MTLALPRAMMAIATAFLGDHRRDWAVAMRAEFIVAVEHGCPMTFAFGCLTTALQDLLRHNEGRLTLASYCLALGLFVPMAAVDLARVLDFFLGFSGKGVPGGAMLAGAATNPVVGWSQVRAAAVLMLLWVALGIGQLCLAWFLVDRDWSHIVHVGAVSGAALVTLLLLVEILLLDVAALIPQFAILAIECLAFAIAARWHTEITHNALAGHRRSYLE